MKLIENRLVGENELENNILRILVADKLFDFEDARLVEVFDVSSPGETGIMTADVEWCHGSLHCEVWIQVEPYDAEPEEPLLTAFYWAFMWRTTERQGSWRDLRDIFEWKDREDASLTVTPSCVMRVFAP